MNNIPYEYYIYMLWYIALYTCYFPLYYKAYIRLIYLFLGIYIYICINYINYPENHQSYIGGGAFVIPPTALRAILRKLQVLAGLTKPGRSKGRIQTNRWLNHWQQGKSSAHRWQMQPGVFWLRSYCFSEENTVIHLYGDYDAILQLGQSHKFEVLKPVTTLVSG